mgnify:CR=1 FL=1
MIISKINLNNDIINHINNMKIDDIFLINIFKNGVCITQNINENCNFSIFIEKNKFDVLDIQKECSFVITDINILSDIEIIKNELNEYKMNNNIKIINDSCNICKNLLNLKFTKTDITYNNLNIDKKLDFLNSCKFEIIISNKFNGIVLKTTQNNIIIYLNILYTPD